jgi:HCOMODA/2-hydroxy-3-carboxy-muconic semialdehyde decarboxylase
MAANRILADQGVVDGYGHVSLRHPADPQRYLMSRSIAPELVTVTDIMEYDLDSTAVDARGRTSYLERFIHGEIYRVRPDVLAIVHNHSPSIIPFGVSTVPCGRSITRAPSWAAACRCSTSARPPRSRPTCWCVTPRWGGPWPRRSGPVRWRSCGTRGVVVGTSLPVVVFRSVYTEMNARLQAQAMALGPVTYLDDEEARRAEASVGGTIPRPWELWKKKALGR